MIVAVGIGDSKANDDKVEERRVGQLHSSGAEIIACVKRQFVDAGFETIGREQRFVRSTIHIGNGRFYELRAKVQVDDHILRGFAT